MTNVNTLPSEVARTPSAIITRYKKWIECQGREELFRELQRNRVGTTAIEHFLAKYFA